MRRSGGSIRTKALVGALAVLALAPAAAQASMLKVAGPTLSYVDPDPGARNAVTIRLSSDGKTFTVTEAGRAGRNTIQITGDGSCTGGRGSGSCPAAGVSLVDVETGDLDDSITLSAPTAGRLAGGPGDDKITGGSGDDTLRGEGGADVLAGDGGRDVADYSDRTLPLVVTLDGNAGDGEAGEGDNVASDIEVLLGGAANDALTGGDGDNVLQGNAGNDTLAGGGGADSLDGGLGNDALLGGEGDDLLAGGPGDDGLDGGGAADRLAGGDGTDTATYAASGAGVRVILDGKANDGAPGENDDVDTENVTGSPGDDVLVGNAGPNVLVAGDGGDRLLGGAGADVLDAGPGDDLLQSLDGVRDLVACGDGTDGVASDRPDLRSDCESIKYRALSATGTALHLTRGAVRVPVRCSPATAIGCLGRIAIRAGRRVLGTRTFRLTPGRRWVARIALTRKARALVARKHLVMAVLVVRNRDESGVSTTTRQTIRIAA